MAPKRGRRPKKVPSGGHRRDAALDFMRQFGCEDDLIESTLDELLAVYTEENWGLIELDCYKILRDAIIPDQDQAPETGNQVEALDFDSEKGGAITETDVGAQEEPVAEEAGTEAWKLMPVGEASVMQSEGAAVGNLVVSTEADDGGPTECLTDTGAAGSSSMVLLSSELKGTCADGSNEISVEPLSVVPCSKGNDVKPFGDGVELQHDKPLESLDEHVSCSEPANHGESSGSKDMGLGEDDRNGSVDPRSSRQSLPAPLRRRRRRECYGWLSDDESDEEDYKEHHILQLEPAPLSGNFQRSPQRRPLATDPVSKGNDNKLFSFGGVELQCDKSPEPSGRNELACPLPARNGESSGSEYMDLEDDDCYDSDQTFLADKTSADQATTKPKANTILQLH